jgi:hypothetical protein
VEGGVYSNAGATSLTMLPSATSSETLILFGTRDTSCVSSLESGSMLLIKFIYIHHLIWLASFCLIISLTSLIFVLLKQTAAAAATDSSKN